MHTVRDWGGPTCLHVADDVSFRSPIVDGRCVKETNPARKHMLQYLRTPVVARHDRVPLICLHVRGQQPSRRQRVRSIEWGGGVLAAKVPWTGKEPHGGQLRGIQP